MGEGTPFHTTLINGLGASTILTASAGAAAIVLGAKFAWGFLKGLFTGR